MIINLKEKKIIIPENVLSSKVLQPIIDGQPLRATYFIKVSETKS